MWFCNDDGGRYIGTGSVAIMRERNGDWVNLGTYRVMIHDEKSAGIFMLFISFGFHWSKSRLEEKANVGSVMIRRRRDSTELDNSLATDRNVDGWRDRFGDYFWH